MIKLTLPLSSLVHSHSCRSLSFSKIIPMLQSYLFDFGDPVNSTRVAHRSMDTTLVVTTLRKPQFWLLPPTVDFLAFITVRHTFL